MRVLLVENHPKPAQLIRDSLSRSPKSLFEIKQSASLSEAIEQLKLGGIDIVLLTLNLPDSRGEQTAQALRAAYPAIPLIVLADDAHEPELALKLIRGGVQDYLTRSELTQPLLERSLRYAVERQQVEAKFHALLEAGPDPVVVTDSRENIVLVNSQSEKTFGYKREELLGQTIDMVVPGFRPGILVDPKVRMVQTGLELTGVRKDRTSFPIEIALSPLRAAEDVWVSISIRDVSERLRAQRALEASERLFRSLVDEVEDYAIFALDSRGMVVSWNSGAERIKGYSAQEAIGHHFSRFYPEEDRKDGRAQVAMETARSKGRFTGEGWRVRKDGSRFWASVVITALHDNNGNVVGFSKITRDLSERKRAEQQLRQSEEKFSKAFQSSPLAVTISTLAEGRYIDVNEAFLQIIGQKREDLIGSTALQTSVWTRMEDRAAIVEELRKKGRVSAYEATFNSRSDGEREVQIFAETIQLDGTQCVLAVTQDVTDTRRIERERQIAQKMEATGKLAGGIAHDFNNVLNVIIGYCELLLGSAELNEPARKQIAEVNLAATRAADLTRQLLAFGRRQVLQVRLLDLNTVVKETDGMLRRLIGEDVEIGWALSESVWPIHADPTQMVQVIMNLVVNARDAMPTGGKITIETANVTLNGEYVQVHPQVPKGDYVRLTVTDTGIGMDQETKSRVFEPFFTTKEMGKGTGLGLATVYGIVKQSGGFIWVYSEPGQGTAFKLYFPRAEGPAASDMTQPAPEHEGYGTETILVLEDNDQLREVARAFLESSGYKVLDTGDPEIALDIARSFAEPIHLLLTDVVLPKMSGRVLAEEFHKVRPETKIVFVSGYTDDVIVRHGILNESVVFLQKPYTREDLTRKIRDVLG